MLRILAGLETSDSGELLIAKDTKIAYVPQENQNVHLDPADHTLSSGQKTKAILEDVLFKKPDVLLLDEPTNNIDLPTVIWLEEFLKKSDIACIIVSHDRRFLDAVSNKIAEIDANDRTLTIRGGTYSDFIEQAKMELHRQKELHDRQQQEIDRLNQVVRDKKEHELQGRQWEPPDNDKLARGFFRDKAAASGRRAKAIETRVGHLERDQVADPNIREPLVIKLNSEQASGNQEIKLTDVVAGYKSTDGKMNFVLAPISLEIRYGNRVGIVGLNGSGKSTLLKTIIGSLPALSGEVVIGSGLRIGNLLQEHETLPREDLVVDYFMQKTGLTEPLTFNTLQKYSFSEWQIRQPISVLSPGGRTRLLLAVFAVLGINTLILDEPTNHLDIEALDALEELLETYTGTVVLVSHDRYFMEKAKLDYIYLLENSQLTKLDNYQSYLDNAENMAQKLLKHVG